jgi:hypothetical protein
MGRNRSIPANEQGAFMLNRKQLLVMWLGLLLTAYLWIGSSSFPEGSYAERVDSRYAQMIAVVTLALVLSLANRRKEPKE